MQGMDRIRGILMGAVAGDALGAPLDGLGRAHIRAVLGPVETYADAEPALKNRMERWKKPGLYSSTSQLMLLLALFRRLRPRHPAAGFALLVRELPPVDGSGSGIFRHPGPMETAFLSAISPGKDDHLKNDYRAHCARMIPMCAPAMAISPPMGDDLEYLISLSLLFNRDPDSIAGTLIFTRLLKRCLAANAYTAGTGLITAAAEETRRACTEMEDRSHVIFSLSLNPDTLLKSARDILAVLKSVEGARDRRAAEEIIVSGANKIRGGHITRATVNDPLAVLPFAIFLCDEFVPNPSGVLAAAAGEGGSAGILASLCGSLAGAHFGESFLPDRLVRDLVNRKRITGLIAEIASGTATEGTMREFISSEAPLTIKELQEFAARNRLHAPRKKKPKPARDRERELSRHVIESWTKLDKAKWRKEKQKRGPDRENG